MQFIKHDNPKIGQDDLSRLINNSLIRSKVLWLISGGSNIPIEVNILNNINQRLINNLYILLVDERYGLEGHQNSNYQQLLAAGFKINKINFPNILEDSLPPLETLDRYLNIYNQFKEICDITIGQFGLGNDGHIAGVLPNSPAVYSNEQAIFYESEPYKRLTLTLDSIKNINQAYVFCFGKDKEHALKRLYQGTDPLEILPSIVLRKIPRVKVYNDLIEEEK